MDVTDTVMMPRHRRRNRRPGMVAIDGPLETYPPELVARVAGQAARDADLTADFLRGVGLAPLVEAGRLPAGLLLQLGAAMRLMAFEAEGLDPTRHGMPSAEEAILGAFRDATRRLDDPSTPPATVGRDVFLFSVARLAWAGPREMHAEVLLDVPDEDTLVEAMARFLWDRRMDVSPGEGGRER